MLDFVEEMIFDVEGPGKKSNRDRTLIKLLEITGFMISLLQVFQIRYFYHLILTNYLKG